ncbi:conserved hypothetical protein [Neospora caninum Liverpool]|nr:conserved hypothetical protein [Neospora caninum Liverpool]CBZ54015.1 conserved hypothetical protein [Neospora caninum Liverpool]|eukprot:XP_003884047.1 conserved hypothetical protein [Neospora caninum Liverpool]
MPYSSSLSWSAPCASSPSSSLDIPSPASARRLSFPPDCLSASSDPLAASSVRGHWGASAEQDGNQCGASVASQSSVPSCESDASGRGERLAAPCLPHPSPPQVRHVRFSEGREEWLLSEAASINSIIALSDEGPSSAVLLPAAFGSNSPSHPLSYEELTNSLLVFPPSPASSASSDASFSSSSSRASFACAGLASVAAPAPAAFPSFAASSAFSPSYPSPSFARKEAKEAAALCAPAHQCAGDEKRNGTHHLDDVDWRCLPVDRWSTSRRVQSQRGTANEEPSRDHKRHGEAGTKPLSAGNIPRDADSEKREDRIQAPERNGRMAQGATPDGQSRGGDDASPRHRQARPGAPLVRREAREIASEGKQVECHLLFGMSPLSRTSEPSSVLSPSSSLLGEPRLDRKQSDSVSTFPPVARSSPPLPASASSSCSAASSSAPLSARSIARLDKVPSKTAASSPPASSLSSLVFPKSNSFPQRQPASSAVPRGLEGGPTGPSEGGRGGEETPSRTGRYSDVAPGARESTLAHGETDRTAGIYRERTRASDAAVETRRSNATATGTVCALDSVRAQGSTNLDASLDGPHTGRHQAPETSCVSSFVHSPCGRQLPTAQSTRTDLFVDSSLSAEPLARPLSPKASHPSVPSGASFASAAFSPGTACRRHRTVPACLERGGRLVTVRGPDGNTRQQSLHVPPALTAQPGKSCFRRTSSSSLRSEASPRAASRSARIPHLAFPHFSLLAASPSSRRASFSSSSPSTSSMSSSMSSSSPSLARLLRRSLTLRRWTTQGEASAKDREEPERLRDTWKATPSSPGLPVPVGFEQPSAKEASSRVVSSLALSPSSQRSKPPRLLFAPFSGGHATRGGRAWLLRKGGAEKDAERAQNSAQKCGEKTLDRETGSGESEAERGRSRRMFGASGEPFSQAPFLIPAIHGEETPAFASPSARLGEFVEAPREAPAGSRAFLLPRQGTGIFDLAALDEKDFAAEHPERLEISPRLRPPHADAAREVTAAREAEGGGKRTPGCAEQKQRGKEEGGRGDRSGDSEGEERDEDRNESELRFPRPGREQRAKALFFSPPLFRERGRRRHTVSAVPFFHAARASAASLSSSFPFSSPLASASLPMDFSWPRSAASQASAAPHIQNQPPFSLLRDDPSGERPWQTPVPLGGERAETERQLHAAGSGSPREEPRSEQADDASQDSSTGPSSPGSPAIHFFDVATSQGAQD